MMPIGKVDKVEEDITSLLKGTDTAIEQYKRGQGVLITTNEELDAFLDNL
jgi:hypothetical protein